MSKYKRLIVFSFFVLASITLVGFVVAKLLLSRDHVRNVAKLQGVLPILADYKVKEFQKFSEYHTLFYARGQFCSRKDRMCIVNLGPEQPFDEQAYQDFAVIEEALSASGVDIDSINARVNNAGELRYAEFGLTCMLCGSDRYTYSLDFGDLPDEVPDNLWHTMITQDWYLIQESWN